MSPGEKASLLFSCEHASAAVPRAYERWFRSARARRALASHRGSDLGALALARALARGFGRPLIAGRATRLLVDLNRSVRSPGLFSEFVSALSPVERAAVVATFHAPHRERVAAAVSAERGLVVHVAVHSFTPRLAGQVRNADIGLLYDPTRAPERELCARWRSELRAIAPELRVRRNYPYRGVADGLPTSLRRRFPTGRYAGVELEINQALATSASERARLGRVLTSSLRRALAGLREPRQA